jgi:hypothetical protein
MRTGRMVWTVLVLIGALAVTVTVAAQAEPGAGVGRLIERPYTAVIEVFMLGSEFAAEVPFSGATSDFDGACSAPVDAVWRFRWAGLDSVFGHVDGTLTVCLAAEWGTDADGAPTMTGVRYVDFGGPFTLQDGSSIDAEMTVRWEGFDEETGQLVSAVSWATSGEGTGRYEGATLYGSTNCRWVSPEALIAGVEPELCVLHGHILYDPFAGAGASAAE